MPVRLPVLPELPEMRCDADCRGCCSEAVPVSETELVAVVLYANEHDIAPQESDPGMCPFYIGGRCAVHPARPLVCRVFGHAPEVSCERGYNVNMGPEEQAACGEAFRELGPPTRFLHEVRKTGRALVHPEVWRYVNDNRKIAGLPALEMSPQ